MFDDLGSWLLNAALPIVRKVLTSLGLGYVSFEGYSALGDQVKDAFLANYGGLSAAMLQVFALAGINTAIGVILAAITVKLSFTAFGRIARIVA